MGRIRQWLRLEESASTRAQSQELTSYRNHVEVLSEGVAQLELALEDKGWDRLLGQHSEEEFSRAGLKRASKVCRVMNLANPLIKRGLAVRQGYVWGSGVEVAPRDPQLAEVVSRFWDDPSNQATFTGDQAQGELETALGTDGNVALALFTNPRTGRVQVRVLPIDEIEDIITAPGDRDTTWYYRRIWTDEVFDERTGQVVTVQQEGYYPDLGYRPRRRPSTINGWPVYWDAPVYHVRVNRQSGWKFGVGDAYAAVTWARGYQEFMADWVTLVKALSQFAWKLSAPTKSKADAARQAVARAGAPQPGNPNTIGATAVTTADMALEAIPKTGATIDAESGKPLAALVASALGIPVTMLLGDPGATGARAVAETLDRPTENEMNQRRSVWANCFKSILDYVVLQAVKAPAGGVVGTVVLDEYTGRESYTMAGVEDATIEVTWPPLTNTDVKTLVEAVTIADATGKMPPLTAARLLLVALGVEDVDELLEEMTDGEGNWLDPYAAVGDAVGQAAIDAYNAGMDPAARVSNTTDDDGDEGDGDPDARQ